MVHFRKDCVQKLHRREMVGLIWACVAKSPKLILVYAGLATKTRFAVGFFRWHSVLLWHVLSYDNSQDLIVEKCFEQHLPVEHFEKRAS